MRSASPRATAPGASRTTPATGTCESSSRCGPESPHLRKAEMTMVDRTNSFIEIHREERRQERLRHAEGQARRVLAVAIRDSADSNDRAAVEEAAADYVQALTDLIHDQGVDVALDIAPQTFYRTPF